jgi:F-type H+-transporting ATPase subunit epsilon
LEPHDRKEPVAGRLNITLVTPAATLLGRDVDEVVAPGVAGEFGVLPGHVPFISALKAGVLTVREGGNRQLYAVGPGYLQVAASGRVQVLVQQALAAGDVDVEGARAARSAAEEQLRQAAGATGAPGAAGRAQADLAWAQAQLDAQAAAAPAGH